jgi:hypothetical protein
MTQNQQTDYINTNYSSQDQYTPAGQVEQAQPVTMLRRIGSTNYRVSVHFSSTSRETMNDKILRMVQSEAVGE